MKVTLLSYTPDAMELLLFSKQTRLEMTPGLMDEIKGWSEVRKEQELFYMSRTIQSSWEFVDFTFLIEGVSRAFTHQFVRNRHGSYAQQTMRVLKVSTDTEPFPYLTPPNLNPAQQDLYWNAMAEIDESYNALIKSGAAIQDARGVLPTNIATNIMCKFNLRTLSELAIKREKSARVQDEYRSVITQMLATVLKVMPWADVFFEPKSNTAVERIAELVKELAGYEYADTLDEKCRMSLIVQIQKELDILRQGL